jgi:hypothetical protein
MVYQAGDGKWVLLGVERLGRKELGALSSSQVDALACTPGARPIKQDIFNII